MKKQILAGLLAFLLVSMFVGCSKEVDDELSTKEFDGVELTMLWNWNGGKKAPADTYNNEIAEAIRKEIGISVEIEGIMMSEVEKLNLLFATGDMPDMIEAPFWGGNGGETAVIKKAAAEGMLLPLDDIIDNYPNLKGAWDVGVVAQAFLENDLNDPSFGGKKYILPMETPSNAENITNWAYGVFCRGDILEDLGVDPTSIKTSEQLYDLLVRIRDGGFVDINGNAVIPATTFHNGWEKGQYTMNFASKNMTGFREMDEGSLEYHIFTDEWMDSQLYLWKLVKEGIFDKESFTQSGTLADEKIGNGTAAMFAAQYITGITAQKKTGVYTSNPEMRYVPIGPLEYADGSPLVQTEAAGRSGAHAMIFPISNSNLEASLTWIDFLNSKEGATLAAYGLEGIDYTFTDEGYPRLLPEIIDALKTDPEGTDNERLDRGIKYYELPKIADQRLTWWGETAPGEIDNAVIEQDEYKKMRPVEVIPGYPLDKYALSFPEYETVSRVAFEGTRLNDTQNRSYFADTEEEARAILQEYRNYLSTAEDGIFIKYMEYVNAIKDDREDLMY